MSFVPVAGDAATKPWETGLFPWCRTIGVLEVLVTEQAGR